MKNPQKREAHILMASSSSSKAASPIFQNQSFFPVDLGIGAGSESVGLTAPMESHPVQQDAGFLYRSK
jgi:hypothetical protein